MQTSTLLITVSPLKENDGIVTVDVLVTLCDAANCPLINCTDVDLLAITVDPAITLTTTYTVLFVVVKLTCVGFLKVMDKLIEFAATEPSVPVPVIDFKVSILPFAVVVNCGFGVIVFVTLYERLHDLQVSVFTKPENPTENAERLVTHLFKSLVYAPDFLLFAFVLVAIALVPVAIF